MTSTTTKPRYLETRRLNEQGFYIVCPECDYENSSYLDLREWNCQNCGHFIFADFTGTYNGRATGVDY